MKVEEHKHLGIIILDSKLSFSAYTKKAVSETRKGTGVLKCLFKYLPRQTLNELLLSISLSLDCNKTVAKSKELINSNAKNTKYKYYIRKK